MFLQNSRSKVKIYQKEDKPEFISNVYYIPNMKSNILSIGKLLEKGYIIHMVNNHLLLKSTNGSLIACVEMTRKRMLPLHLNMELEKCFKGLVENDSWRWHFCFDHLNFNDLKLLSTTGMVHDLPAIDPSNYICEGWIISKQSRVLLFPSEKS